MNELLEQLREQQRILNTIADRTTRLENKLDYMSSVIERMNTNRESRTNEPMH